MSTELTSRENEEPEHYLGPTRYRLTYKCVQCGHEWQKVSRSVPKKDPPCPNASCGAEARAARAEAELAQLRKMLEEQRAPAQIGANHTVKAVDETAKIVMEDYSMTNLRDGISPGESVAPKLDPVKQSLADNYFAGGGVAPAQIPSFAQAPTPHGISQAQMNLLGRRAISGAFRGNAVPPTIVRPQAQRGDSPLTRVGIEPLRDRR